MLDRGEGGLIGLPQLLVFIDIFVEQPEMDTVVEALSKLENVVDLYEVTGEFDVVTLIAVDDLDEFREVLHDGIMKIKGVRSTVSSIVLKVQKGPKQG
jgi:DNA-binding Lrp family transcriptional regulator